MSVVINDAAALALLSNREGIDKDEARLLATCAAHIRDLNDLATAMDFLCVAYRLHRQPREKDLDTINRLKYLIS